MRRRPAAVFIRAAFFSSRLAVNGEAVGRPGEGLRPPFSLIGTTETAALRQPWRRPATRRRRSSLVHFFGTGLPDDRCVVERIGELVVNRAKRRVTLAGHPLRLIAAEYRLLRALSLDAGGVATYETLMRRIWGEQGGGNMAALRRAVTKLRRKLDDDARKPRYVIGERG